MRVPHPTNSHIRAWQRTSRFTQHCYRVARLLYSVVIVTPQIPLIFLSVLFSLSYYGRPHWSFTYRASLLIGSHIAWSLNPGTQPLKDVLSFPARCSIPKLTDDQNAQLEVIPPADEVWFKGDASHPTIKPESCPCFWQWTRDLSPPVGDNSSPLSQRKIVMYFVGGGMVQGHPLTSSIPWRVMQKTHIPIFGVNFRKCVTAKTAFPAALQDALSAFSFLLEMGYRQENISVMGDSGGAGIVITLLLYLNRYSLPMPENAVLISPFVDLASRFDGKGVGEEEEKILLELDFMNNEMLAMAGYQYCENRPELRETLLSPARGILPEGYKFEGLCRCMVVRGDAETFCSGIQKLVNHLRQAGVKVEAVVGKDEVHDYPIFSKADGPYEFYGRVAKFLDGDGVYD
ncbi:uncharacterized protein EAE97_006764 [Botrytis byssoidea]|uniref:Alpha/beta hydrolase fold-3 domain-containing protein n=1 Tax=Botrytis byssoidea TaxID=139641 RepID=A0A9P5M6C7_9HELO|nr:uncharacterized protein EAE97_006764 [Botrytis byssoidea]KAF7941927.1 hypothetical protein EAE97_006764 [Botrytis byssoidea]